MIETIRETLLQEADEIQRLAERLDPSFESAAKTILECKGRVVTTGIGKAGDIAKKASATLSSTGTPSFFLHPADALHGDLGMVLPGDVVVMFSNSGETEELLRIFPPLRQIGATTILITGKPDSTAAKNSDLVLDTSVTREACPYNLAPTTSTTVMLALSDALALAVMKARNFTQDDYARFHPSGALGRRLLLKVCDSMRKGEDVPFVALETPLPDVLRAITKAGAGAAIVSNENRNLLGIITDGDVRRYLSSNPAAFLESRAEQVMTKTPKNVPADMLAVEALELFESLPQKIGEMPVLDGERVVGLVMLKDLVRLGLV